MDSRYSGADNENIMDSIGQYDLVSQDFSLSYNEKRQYVHNLFRGEALSYYYTEIELLGNNDGDVISKFKSQFKSISEQQCVKADLSALSFQEMVEKFDGDRGKALNDLFVHIKAQILLCVRDWGNESGKVFFLRCAPLKENWLDSIYVALHRILAFVSYGLNLLVL